MRANRLQTIKIMALSLGATISASLKILFFVRFTKSPRVFINRIAQRWAKSILRTVKVSLKIFNPHHVEFAPDHNYVIVSNHLSHYDIPLIYTTFPHASIRMIAKKELFQVPLWGQAMRAAEFISVDRNNRRQAVKDLQMAKEKMQSGIILWIAPEGTRSRTGELQPFKKGGFVLAWQTTATIIPVGIRGSNKILPPDTWDFYLNEEVEVHVGVPINSKDYSNIQELINAVENQVKSLIGKCTA